MNKNKTTLAKAVKQAAASMWIDHLPLSRKYVTNYYLRRRLIERRKAGIKFVLAKPKKLTLKKVNRHGGPTF